ncbi:MAG: hypothetical protein L0H93_18370 [Nocardioides sp.]|nr:hypothetical protein [Nocardioides sp.]
MKWLVLVLFAILPLQWFALGSSPLGQVRLHMAAIFAFAGIVLIRYRMRVHAPVLRGARYFILAIVYLATTWGVMDLYNGKLPTGAVQMLLYLVAFVGIATYFFRVAAARDGAAVEALRWAAAVACASVLIGFTIAMFVNGVNGVAVFGRTIAAADPEILQKEVFKSSFAGFGIAEDQVQGNLRHEIFGSVLFSMMVSTWAMRRGQRPTSVQRWVYSSAMVVGSVLLALSLSRSILIAALAWPMLIFFRSVASGRVSPGQVVALVLGAAGLASLSLSGFGTVLWNRFTQDTTGYDARAGNYSGAFDILPDYWLTGGFKTSGAHVSTHNFVLDSWLRGGIFVALAAAAVVLTILLLWTSLVARLPKSPTWLVPVAAALALPVVRLGTSGGGHIPPVEWVALGFVFGVLTASAGARPRVELAEAHPAQHAGSP